MRPRSGDGPTRAPVYPLEEISRALRARLTGLLMGHGLSRSTIDELLQPDSVARLRVILTDRLSAEWDRSHAGDEGPWPRPVDAADQVGKVLVYRSKRNRA